MSSIKCQWTHRSPWKPLLDDLIVSVFLRKSLSKFRATEHSKKFRVPSQHSSRKRGIEGSGCHFASIMIWQFPLRKSCDCLSCLLSFFQLQVAKLIVSISILCSLPFDCTVTGASRTSCVVCVPLRGDQSCHWCAYSSTCISKDADESACPIGYRVKTQKVCDCFSGVKLFILWNAQSFFSVGDMYRLCRCLPDPMRLVSRQFYLCSITWSLHYKLPGSLLLWHLRTLYSFHYISMCHYPLLLPVHMWQYYLLEMHQEEEVHVFVK